MATVPRFLCIALLAVALAAVTALPAGAASSCKTPTDNSWGPTYVTSLGVTKASCATGKAVVKAYYRCRVANGGADGTCRKKVLGYRCTERIVAKIKTQYDAKVTCAKGSARIVHAYEQFT
jgi:hypothetical protein